MKLVGLVAAFAIGLAAAVGYLLMTQPQTARWTGGLRMPAATDGQPAVDRSQSSLQSRAVSARAVGEPADTPVESDSDGSQAIPDPRWASVDQERIATVKGRMAENLYRRAGGLFASRFAARGLAPVDAKAIIRGYFDEIAACVFDAARAEAEARSIEPNAFLADLERGLTSARDSPLGRLPQLAGLDRSAIERRADPCVLDASQEAGIPFR